MPFRHSGTVHVSLSQGITCCKIGLSAVFGGRVVRLPIPRNHSYGNQEISGRIICGLFSIFHSIDKFEAGPNFVDGSYLYIHEAVSQAYFTDYFVIQVSREFGRDLRP